MMSRPVSKFVWFDLLTNDMEAASEFYRGVVGWDIRDAMMPGRKYSVITVGSTMVGGVMPLAEQKAAGGSSWLGYIGVNDVDESVSQVVRAHGKLLRPAEDIPGVGRYAVVCDPQGAAFILFASPGMPTPAPVKADDYGRVGWHQLETNNVKEAINFYAELFGWTETESLSGLPGTTLIAEPGGQLVGVTSSSENSVVHSAWIHCFNVPNLYDAVTKVKQSHGTVTQASTSISGLGAIAQCIDPQGARFALVELSRS